MSARYPAFEVGGDLERDLEGALRKHFGADLDFKWKDDKGALIGPFAVLAYTPDLFRPWMVLADSVLNQKDLGPCNREIACLAVVAVFDAPVLKYAHRQIGGSVGLSQAQIASLVGGMAPEDLTEVETIIYITAWKLARARGPLDDESWREAENKLGGGLVTRVAHVVAWFVYNCTLLSLGAVDVASDSTESSL